MPDEEHIDDWLGIEEAAEVIQAYKRRLNLIPSTHRYASTMASNL